jgi:hypothetical protein
MKAVLLLLPVAVVYLMGLMEVQDYSLQVFGGLQLMMLKAMKHGFVTLIIKILMFIDHTLIKDTDLV